MDNPDGSNKPTEVGIIRFRKNVIEDARSFAVKIVEEFPSLVTA